MFIIEPDVDEEPGIEYLELKDLWTKVVIQAIKDLDITINSTKDANTYNNAKTWILNDNDYSINSFAYICDSYGYNKTVIREGIKHLLDKEIHGGTTYKQLELFNTGC